MADEQTFSWWDDDMVRVLKERLEAVARLHEAEAEIALARSAITRADVKLITSRKLSIGSIATITSGRLLDLGSLIQSLDRG